MKNLDFLILEEDGTRPDDLAENFTRILWKNQIIELSTHEIDVLKNFCYGVADSSEKALKRLARLDAKYTMKEPKARTRYLELRKVVLSLVMAGHIITVELDVLEDLLKAGEGMKRLEDLMKNKGEMNLLEDNGQELQELQDLNKIQTEKQRARIASLVSLSYQILIEHGIQEYLLPDTMKKALFRWKGLGGGTPGREFRVNSTYLFEGLFNHF